MFLTDDSGINHSATKYSQTECTNASDQSPSIDISGQTSARSDHNEDEENNEENRTKALNSDQIISDKHIDHGPSNYDNKKSMGDSPTRKKSNTAADMCDCDIRNIMKMADRSVTDPLEIRTERTGGIRESNEEVVTLLRAANSVKRRDDKKTELAQDCDKDCSMGSTMSSATSSYVSDNHEEEITLAIQAAEITARKEARSRYKSSSDLLHRLFVCISGEFDITTVLIYSHRHRSADCCLIVIVNCVPHISYFLFNINII